ncbi:MAG: GyrI-like domain-containing protein [Holophagales bacterium]|nr:GyrI-like domain-containing protein [Holophagales bacterium]
MSIILSSTLLLQLTLMSGALYIEPDPQDPKAENAAVAEKVVKFETSIVEFPTKKLVGMKVRTSMEKAGADGGALWQAFTPRMSEVCKEPKGMFGVSVMVSESEFDYWAALEMTPEEPLPEGMGEVTILKGAYVRCTVPSIEKMGDAYMYLYTEWSGGQTKYVINQEASAFEHMPGDWQMGKPFDIYVPIKAK